MATKALRQWTTDELETVYSASLDNIQRYEAERILSERERAPERRIIRRTHNAAPWAHLYCRPYHPLATSNG